MESKSCSQHCKRLLDWTIKQTQIQISKHLNLVFSISTNWCSIFPNTTDLYGWKKNSLFRLIDVRLEIGSGSWNPIRFIVGWRRSGKKNEGKQTDARLSRESETSLQQIQATRAISRKGHFRKFKSNTKNTGLQNDVVLLRVNLLVCLFAYSWFVLSYSQEIRKYIC